MSQLEKSDEKLHAEIASLRQELADLKREKSDLELLLQTITEHGDYVEDDLLNKAESAEKKFRKYQEELKSLFIGDISELTKTNEDLSYRNLKLSEALRKESIQDPLTDLYNRRYMEKTLERELSRCRRHDFPLTVIMADIDHFKIFNDTYGHTTAEIILQKLGRFLGTRIRQEDTACRYGDEEFAVILPQTSLENIRQRAEQMRLEVKRDLKIPHQDDILGFTVSMGIAGFPDHGTNLKEILGAADFALCQAKEKGCDRIEVAVKTKQDGSVSQ